VKALVTGATGFVGNSLCRALRAAGWEVDALVRTGGKGALALPAGTHALAIDGGYPSILAAVRGSRPDVVFHLASNFLAQHKPEDIPGLIESNVTFGTHLLEAMGEAGVNRLVNTGTSWQHFEDHEYSPVCLYAATKQAFRAIIRFYVETRPDLKVVELELFDTYGPGDPRKKLIHLLNQLAQPGATPLGMSPGEQEIDLVHIDDVCDAFQRAAGLLLEKDGASTAPGKSDYDRAELSLGDRYRIYAVSSGDPIPLRELAERFGRARGVQLPIQWGGRPYRPREVMSTWKRGVALPGWAPKVDLETGIRGLGGGHG